VQATTAMMQKRGWDKMKSLNLLFKIALDLLRSNGLRRKYSDFTLNFHGIRQVQNGMGRGGSSFACCPPRIYAYVARNFISQRAHLLSDGLREGMLFVGIHAFSVRSCVGLGVGPQSFVSGLNRRLRALFRF